MQTFSPPAASPSASGCDHKNATQCRLDLSKCCACEDLRPHAANYTTYKDGRRTYSGLNRWSHYCASCKGFWERQIQLAGIAPSASRIPEFPKPVAEAPLYYIPRYRPPVQQPLISGELTPKQNIAPVPLKRGGKKRRQKHRHNSRTDQDPSNTLNTPSQASSSSSATRNGVAPIVNLPKPQPYICPAARLHNQTPSRANQNGAVPSLARPKTWANLVTPYSQPILHPNRSNASATSVTLENSHESASAIVGTQTAPPATSSPGPSRRLASWRDSVTSGPLTGPSGTPEERFPTLNWEGVPVPDAADGSWSADVENDWSTHGSANASRSTSEQNLGQALGGFVNTSPPLSPLEMNRSHRTPSAIRRAGLNAQRYTAVQFGDLYNTSPRILASEDRQIAANASTNISNTQPTANVTPEDGLNNRNRGWLDWVGSYVNNAHNRVLEHVNYLDNSQIPGHSLPTPAWGSLQTQSSVNGSDVRRISSTYTLNNAPRPPPLPQNTIQNPSTQQRFSASLYPLQPEAPHERTRTNQVFGETAVGTPTPPTLAPSLYRPGSLSGGRPPPSSPITRSPIVQPPPIVHYPPVIQSPVAISPFSEHGEWESYPPPRVRLPIRDRTPTPGPPALGSSILDFSVAAEDNWLDPHAALVSSVNSFGSDSPILDLAQVAEDASVLLELFGKTKPRNNDEISYEHKQMIDNAFESILKIRREFRVITARKNRSPMSVEPPVSGAEDKVNSECIICYDQVADTVLLPCKHLVLCNICCDKMGIKEKNTPGPRTVQCPICRVKVLDRLKIFRG